MKLKNEFVTMDSDGRQVMVSTDTKLFSGLVRSNSTAAFIIDCLKKETTEDEIADAILEEYEADRETVVRDVRKVIGKLKSIGAIDE